MASIEENSYLEIRDKYRGVSCFIFGAGPSLWSNMHEPFFQEIPKHGITIAVNSAVIAFENMELNYWISTDSLCLNWSWFSDFLRKSKCTKIVRSSWLKEHKDKIKGFYIFRRRNTPENEIDFKENGLMYCNSTNAAIDFAIQYSNKIKKIFICGLDHDTIDGKHHFWQFFEKYKQPRQLKPAQGPFSQQQMVFPIHLESYKMLKKFAEHKGIKIFNCNPKSKVNVFEKIKFEEMLKIIKE